VIAVVMLVIIAVFATRKSADSVIVPSTLQGKLAPVVSGKSLDGKVISLSQYRGRPVVVNFFASWCVPCHEEQDDLVKFATANNKPNDPALVAVLFDDKPSDAKAYFAANGSTWPALNDTGKIAIDFGVRAPPETYVIDANGYVRAKFVGAVTYKSLQNSVDAIKERQ
jgi:cytochrome c biogenesis protein CcmG/thiol:disulfide interchange protein DsbE